VPGDESDNSFSLSPVTSKNHLQKNVPSRCKMNTFLIAFSFFSKYPKLRNCFDIKM